jgi:hypothetical protein
MPVARDTRRLALVMPSWRCQLHPPRFIGPIMAVRWPCRSGLDRGA